MTINNETNRLEDSRQIELKELFADYPCSFPQRNPVTTKLRTILKQLDLGLEIPVLTNNRFLKRLLDECQLFLNEVNEWQGYWEYGLAYKVQECWLKSSLDLLLSDDGEIIILDWSGIRNNPILPIQVYLICLKLNVYPDKVRTVSLFANSLTEERLICFVRQSYYTNDLAIAKQNLEEALEMYVTGDCLLPTSESIASESNLEEIVKLIEAVPEVEI